MNKAGRIARILILAAALAAALQGCVSGGPGTDSTGAASETGSADTVLTDTGAGETSKEEQTMPGYPTAYTVYHKTPYNSSLDWTRQSQRISGTQDYVWWNLDACVKIHANMINAFPNYRDGSQSVAGMQLQKPDEIISYTAPGVAATHALGIKIVTSLPMCLLNKASFKKYGIDYVQYASRKMNGTVSEGTDYAYACINNPLFRETVRNYTVKCAEAGYDGMFFDANPYAYGVKFNCCCDYCRSAWAEYSKSVTGSEIKLITSEPNLSTEEGRLFMKWRRDIYIDFVLQLRDECRKYVADFGVWPNFGFNGMHTYYYTLKGLEDALCEYGANSLVESGVNSTLYAFASYEAANPERQLLTQFNNTATQASPDYKWYTAYAETMAFNGDLMSPASSKGTGTYFKFIDGCNKIREADPEAYSDSANAADVAVVFSWQNLDLYNRAAGNVAFGGNGPRKIASTLAKRGVPFAFIMPENTTDISALMRYRTVILPDMQLLDKNFEALLYENMQAGGQVLLCGSGFALDYVEEYGYKYPEWDCDVLEKWTGTPFSSASTGSSFEVGKGSLRVVKTYLSSSTEATAEETSAYTGALEAFGVRDLVSVEEDVTGFVETTLRSDAEGSRWWLSLITVGSAGVYDDRPVTVTVRIPEGQTVSAVSGSSPTVSAENMGLKWEQDGNRLKITATVGIFSVLRIEKN